MIPIGLYIPHIQNEKENRIQTSPYHRWEHIFVRILQNLPEKRIVNVSGSTNCEGTQILICLSDNLSIDCIQKFFHILRYSIPSKDILRREVVIINNELSCLSQLYHYKKVLCEEGMALTQNEMMKFRRSKYNWDETYFSYCTNNPLNSPNKVQHETPQKLIANKRNSLMKDLVCCENKRCSREDGFYLYRFCKDVWRDIPDKIWEMAIEEMDAANGFLIKRMRNRWALSFLIWPSWEKEDDFTGLQVFTFIKGSYVNIFWDILCDWLCCYFNERGYDRVIEKHFQDYVKIYN